MAFENSKIDNYCICLLFKQKNIWRAGSWIRSIVEDMIFEVSVSLK